MGRASQLSPPDFRRLDWACRPVAEAFGEPVYLVGSVLDRPDYRDIDLRLILADAAVERMFNGSFGVHEDESVEGVRRLLNVALSDLVARAANAPAPIDFQIQSMTEANVPAHGRRHALGLRITG